MASMSTQTIVWDGLLHIETVKDLPRIIRDLESDSNLAKQLTGIEIKDDVAGFSNTDANGRFQPIAPEVYEQFGLQVTKIIQEIQHCSVLKKFTWGGIAPKGTRPFEFWEALCTASTTLNELTICFRSHELHAVSKLTLPKLDFSMLNSLQIYAGGADGEDGTLIDSILRSSHALQTLDLSFPICDLEGCRIKGITWNYTFPSLQTLKLTTYNSDDTALSNFLLRCPRIHTIYWSVESDYSFVFPQDSLHALRNLSLNDDVSCYDFEANFEVLANFSPLLEHLETSHLELASYFYISKLGRSLTSLRLDPGVYSWREGFVEPGENSNDEWNKHHDWEVEELEAETGMRQLSQIITKMLAGLPQLEELDVNLETAHTSSNGIPPEPLDDKDLISMLTLLSPDGKLRVLRMSDSRALPLSNALLQDFPATPKSLEVLKWNMGKAIPSKHERVYLLRRDGDRVKAVQQNDAPFPLL